MRNSTDIMTQSFNSTLVCDRSDIAQQLVEQLSGTMFEVTNQSASLPKLAMKQLEFTGMFILAVRNCDSDMMALIDMLLRQQPMPVVIFTDAYDAQVEKQAIQLGVSAYVVDGLQPHRVLPLLSTARNRFLQQQTMREQVQSLETKLAERKIIDRAKGVLMQQRQCSEDEAYRLLRTTAMNQNMRLAMLAKQVLATANLLETHSHP
ncbi:MULTISPECIES: ANTAR domain-containing response regulator [Methylophaga]|jgi:response regulator NasT|uniref:Putative transcriptional regulatory protein pdtaR n=1 Tax=Methylophaga muralis TaxID=291169 RepID=A0A1E3GT89_9GAMM|nr:MULTISPECIES: ANTAR domain-containing protein [Methylophaga]ODN67224.1 putative transcriptional regulatory protein pdtaR [Methylophaga muralis]